MSPPAKYISDSFKKETGSENGGQRLPTSANCNQQPGLNRLQLILRNLIWLFGLSELHACAEYAEKSRAGGRYWAWPGPLELFAGQVLPTNQTGAGSESMRGNRLGGSCFPFPVRPLWRLATLAELATLATLVTLVYPRYLGRYPPAPNHAITRAEIPKSR